MGNKQLIEEVQKKIEFATTIAIFFAGVLHYFYSIYSPEEASRVALQYSAAVIFFLLSYICFEFIKEFASRRFFIYLDNLLILNFLILLGPLGYFVVLKNDLTLWESVFLKVFIWGVLIFPILIFLSMFLYGLWVVTNKFFKKS